MTKLKNLEVAKANIVLKSKDEPRDSLTDFLLED